MFLKTFERCTPEEAGVSSDSILDFIQSIEEQKLGLHSFMLLRHGKVACEGWWHPYAPESPHMLFSLTKSFTSTAVGLAISEGYLTLNDPVLSYFPEDTFGIDTCYLNGPFLEAMTVRFSGNQLEGELTQNVSFGPTKVFPFKATAKE